jgi:hypothetical protein
MMRELTGGQNSFRTSIGLFWLVAFVTLAVGVVDLIVDFLPRFDMFFAFLLSGVSMAYAVWMTRRHDQTVHSQGGVPIYGFSRGPLHRTAFVVSVLIFSTVVIAAAVVGVSYLAIAIFLVIVFVVTAAVSFEITRRSDSDIAARK